MAVDLSRVSPTLPAGEFCLLASNYYSPEKISINKIQGAQTATLEETSKFCDYLTQLTQIHPEYPHQIIVLTQTNQKEQPKAFFAKINRVANFLDTNELNRLNSDIEYNLHSARPVKNPLNPTQQLLNLARVQLQLLHQRG